MSLSEALNPQNTPVLLLDPKPHFKLNMCLKRKQDLHVNIYLYLEIAACSIVNSFFVFCIAVSCAVCNYDFLKGQ